MKILNYLMIILSFIAISCKKPVGNEHTVPAPIYFNIIGQNGNNVIHSLKDTLVVTYVMNGLTKNSRLTVYKVQASPTDTTLISQYNGFVITDLNPLDHQGYISSPSGAGVRNFSLYLNGVSIGSIYLDYWGYLSTAYPHSPSSTFTFGGENVMLGSLSGAFSDGSQIVQVVDAGFPIYLFRMK